MHMALQQADDYATGHSEARLLPSSILMAGLIPTYWSVVENVQLMLGRSCILQAMQSVPGSCGFAFAAAAA